MIKLQTKEHLVYFMQCGMMKLSSHDLHFVQNIHNIINRNEPITTNQVKLLDKLIDKYRRQFNKHKYDSNFIHSLKWHSKIIESSVEHTRAYISISEGKILFKSPFNKKFLTELRKLNFNPFKWNNESKFHHAEYSTHSLKILYNLANKYYPNISYCPITQSLLNTLKSFDKNLIWEPTLVMANGMLLIAASNQFVDKAIKDVIFNIDLKTITKLNSYGIKISDELSSEEKFKFAGSFVYETDIKELNKILYWLKDIGSDCVIFAGLGNISLRSELHSRLNQLGIHYYNQSDILFTTNKMVNSSYDSITYIQFTITPKLNYNTIVNKYNVKKIVKVNNSYPVALK